MAGGACPEPPGPGHVCRSAYARVNEMILVGLGCPDRRSAGGDVERTSSVTSGARGQHAACATDRSRRERAAVSQDESCSASSRRGVGVVPAHRAFDSAANNVADVHDAVDRGDSSRGAADVVGGRRRRSREREKQCTEKPAVGSVQLLNFTVPLAAGDHAVGRTGPVAPATEPVAVPTVQTRLVARRRACPDQQCP